jgi:hypothetical protein
LVPQPCHHLRFKYAVLAELEKKQPVANATIIALGEHVDYWNYLGWSDPFSAAIYSSRQQGDARTLNANVYTPQMVVDGRAEFIGSNAAQAAEAIAKAARARKTKVQIVRSPPDKIKITATDIPLSRLTTNATSPWRSPKIICRATWRAAKTRGANSGTELSCGICKSWVKHP